MNVKVPTSRNREPDRANNFGLRWQAERDTAFDRTTRVETSTLLLRSKAPSTLRSAGAVQDAGEIRPVQGEEDGESTFLLW
jgi:hypothetical protein